MKIHPLTDDLIKSRIELLERNGGNINRTAVELGIARSTLQSTIAIAARKGMMGTAPVLPGFGISKTTTVTDETGRTVREFIQQRPLPDGKFSIPEGHEIKGVSALVDGQGNVVQSWYKTREGDNSGLTLEAIKAAFEGYSGRAEASPQPADTDDDLLTTYIVGDHHLGLLAWGKESGADYDLSIGERQLRGSMGSLVAQAPKSATAIVLNLGDFFHADNPKNRTEQSGNALDVDGRFAKIMQIGVQLMIDCIEMALAKHRRVIVRCLPGNHDPNSAVYLSIALAAFFSKDERVTIDCDPSKFFWHRFGSVFIGATHGDMVKPEQMPGVMASYRAEDWGKTKHRYAYFGHVHHRSKGGGEMHGVVWETFQTLAAKDYWHASSGYSSGRSMTAITHHRERGEIYRHMVQAQ